ncbi:MAG: hypothetical protein OEV40_27610, partial [Acidimicrobiia bacterium]|nr:hypothetical protein [Acidimicrobiia bacterium]
TVEPPGVGDNGSWSPLSTETIDIPANDFEDISVNWVPVVDRHTCLKVFAQHQLGEVTTGNNSAQENVFDFEAPASSVPEPVRMPVAVRNPLDQRVIVHLRPSRVPAGYAVHFPHRWLWLDPKAERHFDLTIIPTEDYGWYREVNRDNLTTDISLQGDVPRVYQRPAGGTIPASWAFPIGGITMSVTPKQRVSLEIEAGQEGDGIYVRGTMSPGLRNERVRVDFTDPYGYLQVAETDTVQNGAFSLFYSLRDAQRANEELVSVDPVHLPPGHPGTFPVWGAYRVQAHTANSPNAAEASSNTVIVVVPEP